MNYETFTYRRVIREENGNWRELKATIKLKDNDNATAAGVNLMIAVDHLLTLHKENYEESGSSQGVTFTECESLMKYQVKWEDNTYKGPEF